MIEVGDSKQHGSHIRQTHCGEMRLTLDIQRQVGTYYEHPIHSEHRAVRVNPPRKAKIQRPETRGKAIQPGRIQEILALDRSRSFHLHDEESNDSVQMSNTRGQSYLLHHAGPERDLARQSVEMPPHEGCDPDFPVGPRSHRRVLSDTIHHDGRFERVSHRKDPGHQISGFVPVSQFPTGEVAGEPGRPRPSIFAEHRAINVPNSNSIQALELHSSASLSTVPQFEEPSISKPQGSVFPILVRGPGYSSAEHSSRKNHPYSKTSSTRIETQRDDRSYPHLSNGRGVPARAIPYPTRPKSSQQEPGRLVHAATRQETIDDPFHDSNHPYSYSRTHEGRPYQSRLVESSSFSDPYRGAVLSPSRVGFQEKPFPAQSGQAAGAVSSASRQHHSQGVLKSPQDIRVPHAPTERRQSFAQPLQ
jgi:hypothetical protein